MNKRGMGLQKAAVFILLLLVLLTVLIVSYGPKGLLTNIGKLAGDVGSYLGDMLMPAGLSHDDMDDSRQIKDKKLSGFVKDFTEEVTGIIESSKRADRSCYYQLDTKAPDFGDDVVTFRRRGDDGLKIDVTEVDGNDKKQIAYSTINNIKFCAVYGDAALNSWYNRIEKDKNTLADQSSQLMYVTPERILFTDEKLKADGLDEDSEAAFVDDKYIYLYYDAKTSTSNIMTLCLIPTYDDMGGGCDLEEDLREGFDYDSEKGLLDSDCIDRIGDAGGYTSLPNCRNPDQVTWQTPSSSNSNTGNNPADPGTDCGNGICEPPKETMYNCNIDCKAQ